MEKQRILIVDDDEKNIKLLNAMLRMENYELSASMSGEDVFRKLDLLKPDLILLDVMLPGINGFEVCKRLKSDENTRMIPVVLVTGLSEREHRLQAMEVGADDFLTKPVDQLELLIRVKSLLRIKMYNDELKLKYREITLQNQKLEELEKVKDGLNHMIVHDLNNPLFAISGSLQLLLFGSGELPKHQVEVLETCYHYCEDLSRQIRSLTDIHRMENASLELKLEKTDMSGMMKDIFSMFKTRCKSKNIEISMKAIGGIPIVNIDAGLIRRVISNLLSNAVRHTPAGGKITGTVDFNSEYGEVRVRITDSGEGIDPIYHKKIFNKFEQVRLSHAGSAVGSSGLGLAFCKMAVEAHDGKISIESTGDNTGSVFTVLIPAILTDVYSAISHTYSSASPEAR
jgi:two-component system, sensor histidine kinase and response regulator